MRLNDVYVTESKIVYVCIIDYKWVTSLVNVHA